MTQKLNPAFIVICDCVKSNRTILSIKLIFPDTEIIQIENNLKEINSAISNIKSEWIFIIKNGSFIRKSIKDKYFYFVKSEKDILYAIIDRKINFVDNPFQGILFNKNIHLFPESLTFEQAKLIWALKAIKDGYILRGIVGANLVLS